MWTDIIDRLFSFACCGNDARSFVIGGHVLPFCQRCTGVYLGLGITFIYLIASQAPRRGLPGGLILVGIWACVAVMVVFGCHWVDPGAKWRFWSGLVFGDALAWLLLPAACVLWRGRAGEGCGYSNRSYFVLLGVLSLVPFWFPADLPGIRVLVCGIAAIGIGGVVFCAAAATAGLIKSIGGFIVKGAAHGYAGS